MGTPPDAPLDAAAAQERLTRVSRMRTLSAMLDDDVDEQLPPELLAMFSQNSAKLQASRATGGDGNTDDDDEPASDFLCVECRAHESEVFCEQCHDYFCELCYGGQHRKGNRKKHTFQPRIVATATSDSSAVQASSASVNMSDAADARMQDEGDDSNEVRGCAEDCMLLTILGDLQMLMRVCCCCLFLYVLCWISGRG